MEKIKIYSEHEIEKAFNDGVSVGKKTNKDNTWGGSYQDYKSWRILNDDKMGHYVMDEILESVYQESYIRMFHENLRVLTLDAVVDVVSNYTGFSKEYICTHKCPAGKPTGKDSRVVQARALAMYFAYYHSPVTIREIGEQFCQCHHGTVISHVKKWTYYIYTNAYARKVIETLYSIFKGMGYNVYYYNKPLDSWDSTTLEDERTQYRLTNTKKQKT